MKIKNNCLTYKQIIKNPNLLLNKFIFVNYENGCGYDIFYFYKIKDEFIYFFRKDVYYKAKKYFYFDCWKKEKMSISSLIEENRFSQMEII